MIAWCTQTHTHTHTQAQDDNASSDTAIIYEEKNGIQGRCRSAGRPVDDHSLSLSRISLADDSEYHSGSLNSSFDSGSGRISDHTPAMREGNTDDTMSDSAVFQRTPRRVSVREQWMTTSDFGSPWSSSTAQSTSMPSLERPTTSFQEGSGQASLNQASSSRGSSQGEWSSVDEDEPSITASVAFRGEIFALNATSNLSDTDHVPPKGIAQGMQI